MHADDRLNQLEPLISESMAILDRHTAQLKQLTVASGQIITAIAQQGDIINFLLREQIEIKGDIAEMKGDIAELKGDVAELKGDVAELKGDVAELKGDVAELKGDVAGLKNGIIGLNDKLDQVLSLLQKPGQ